MNTNTDTAKQAEDKEWAKLRKVWEATHDVVVIYERLLLLSASLDEVLSQSAPNRAPYAIRLAVSDAIAKREPGSKLLHRLTEIISGKPKPAAPWWRRFYNRHRTLISLSAPIACLIVLVCIISSSPRLPVIAQDAHVHKWGQWSEPQFTSSAYAGTRMWQSRTCTTCGQAEPKLTVVSAFGK